MRCHEACHVALLAVAWLNVLVANDSHYFRHPALSQQSGEPNELVSYLSACR